MSLAEYKQEDRVRVRDDPVANVSWLRLSVERSDERFKSHAPRDASG